MKIRIIYRNPISGKKDFIYTHCVLCGRRVSLNKNNLGKNRFGDVFYYCKKHQKKAEKEILNKDKEIAFKWYCIGYREIERTDDDEDTWLSDEELRREFEMEWEYQKERERKEKGDDKNT